MTPIEADEVKKNWQFTMGFLWNDSRPEERFCLNAMRQTEVVERRGYYERRLRWIRRAHFTEVDRTEDYAKRELHFLEEPAWWSISTSPSDARYRLAIGFRNSGCRYRRVSRGALGCLQCGFGSGALRLGRPSEAQILRQFDRACHHGLKQACGFDVVEFLGDGSFLNDEEWLVELRDVLFERFAAIPYVKRILIESRPEHIEEGTVSRVLKQLRTDQLLEIAIGLETQNDFIREECINKGFAATDLENAVVRLLPLRKRCSVVGYVLLKPAFLSESEAVLDAVSTIQYLSEVSQEFQIGIVPKIEPAVIARGTILDLLHFHVAREAAAYYSPPSYWSVVEAISRAHQLGLSGNIRVGAREDMHIIEKVPAVYDDNGMFNQYEFWLYDAVQRFNVDHDMVRLLGDVKAAVTGDGGLKKWREVSGCADPAVLACMDAMEPLVTAVRDTEEQRSRERFLRHVFAVLDRIELEPGSCRFAASLMKVDQEILRQRSEEFINDKFRAMNVVAEVRWCAYERNKPHMRRVYFQLRHFPADSVHDIWVGIPTTDYPAVV